MKRSLFAAGLVALALLGWGMAREQNPQPPAAGNADTAAIRANVEAFVAAFNKHDAKAIGALFAPDAKAIDGDDRLVDGREAITRVFADLFAGSPQATIKVAVDAINFVGPDLALETGTTLMTASTDEQPELSRYTVVHVKHDGKWAMALARDTDVDSLTAHDHLRPLGWLVGDWVDESTDGVVMTHCQWSPDGNYLLQDIVVKRSGKAAMNVSQRIGYDPVRKCVRSWAFDSAGGFIESAWTRTDGGWVIKATGASGAGDAGSATNSLVRTGPDSFIWRSTDRIVGGEVVAPVEVRVVRRPPAAGVKN